MPQMMGWQRYMNIRPEVTWGTRDAGGTDIYLPFSSNGILTQVQSTQADLFTGLRQRRHNRVNRATCGGQIVTPLFGYHVSSKSIAQHLIEWAQNGPSTAFIDSMTVDIADANDAKRYTGSRVNSLTLAGDASSGIVTATIDVQCKDETGGITPGSVPATAPQPVEFSFDEVEFYLSSESEGESATASAEAVPIRSFSLSLVNNLQVYHTNSFFPTSIPAGVRQVGFNFEIFKESNTYDSIRRTSGVTNRAAHLVLKCPHLGTAGSGTKTKIDIYFDRLNFANASDTFGLNELVTQSVEWIVLKPNTTENEIEFAFSTVS